MFIFNNLNEKKDFECWSMCLNEKFNTLILELYYTTPDNYCEREKNNMRKFHSI